MPIFLLEFKQFWRVWKPPREVLEASWHVLEASCMPSTPPKLPGGLLGASCAPLRTFLEPSWRLLDPLGTALKSTWNPLGGLLGRPGGFPGPPWDASGASQGALGCPTHTRKPPRRPRRPTEAPKVTKIHPNKMPKELRNNAKNVSLTCRPSTD